MELKFKIPDVIFHVFGNISINFPEFMTDIGICNQLLFDVSLLVTMYRIEEVSVVAIN